MIYIPKDFMVGFQRRSNDRELNIDTDFDNEYILGFATYKDEKGKIRCERSFNNWRYKENPVLTFDNSLLENFKIVGTETRGTGGWSSTGRSVYDIKDPRGFVLQINSGNLIEIINQCEIKNGIIQNKCLWSWEGSTLILTPEGTDLYNDGMEGFRLKNQKVGLKDLTIGDEITLSNGDKCIWYGGQHITYNRPYHRYKNPSLDFVLEKQIRRYILLYKDQTSYGYKEPHNKFEIKSSIKVSEINKHSDVEITPEEVSKILNEQVKFIYDKDVYNRGKDYKDCDRSLLNNVGYYNLQNIALFSPTKLNNEERLQLVKDIIQDDAIEYSIRDEKEARRLHEKYIQDQRNSRNW